MRKKHLMASGLPALAVQNIGGIATAGLTATGTTQTDALISSADLVYFSTVASGTGYRLPAEAEPNDWYVVYNGGANALNVYPHTGGNINALSQNAAFSLAANKLAFFFRITDTLWASNLTA